MSDDWQVVADELEYLLTAAVKPGVISHHDAEDAEVRLRASLARLREREARLMSRGIEDMQHQIARLEEALRGVIDFGDRASVQIARRALAHEEEKT